MADSGKDKKNLKYGKKKRGRRKRRRPAEAVLMFIFAGIFVFSAVQLLLIFGEYKQGNGGGAEGVLPAERACRRAFQVKPGKNLSGDHFRGRKAMVLGERVNVDKR